MPIIIVVTKCKDHPLEAPLSVKFGPEGGTIGRSADCGLVLADVSNYVSRLHARVVYQNGQYVLQQKGGNATVVNGRTVAAQESVTLASHDSLIMGPYQLLVEVEPEFSLPNRGMDGNSGVSPGDMIDLLLADEVFSSIHSRAGSQFMVRPIANSVADPIAPPPEAPSVEPEAVPLQPPPAAEMEESPNPNLTMQSDDLSGALQDEESISSGVEEISLPQTEADPARLPRRVLKLTAGTSDVPPDFQETSKPQTYRDEDADKVNGGGPGEASVTHYDHEVDDPPPLVEAPAALARMTDQSAFDAAISALKGARPKVFVDLRGHASESGARSDDVLLQGAIDALQRASSPGEHEVELAQGQTPALPLQSAGIAAGINAVANALLTHLAPSAMEFRVTPPSWMDRLVPARRIRHLWENYLDVHSELATELAEDSNGWLLELFLSAYHDAQAKQGDAS